MGKLWKEILLSTRTSKKIVEKDLTAFSLRRLTVSIPNLIQNTELLTSIFEEKLRRKTPAVASATAKFSEQIFTKKAKSEVRCFGLGWV